MTTTKRILGGIAWTWAILLMPSAFAQTGSALPQGLTSKDYLRMMAEANEVRDAAAAAQGLTPGVIPPPPPMPQWPLPQAPRPQTPPQAAPQQPPPQQSHASQPPIQPNAWQPNAWAQSPSQPSPSQQSWGSQSWGSQNSTSAAASAQPFVQNQAVSSAPMVSPATALMPTPPASPSPPKQPGIASPLPYGTAKPSPYGTVNPTLSASIEQVWLRRQGDNGTTWSDGGLMGSLGEDTAGLYRIGWYTNPMERYEFAFMGSFVWERSAEHSGPVDGRLTPSPLQPDWFDLFEGSQEHEHTHTARLRTYELNHRWITDDLGNHFVGIQIIDYQEVYGLESQDSDGNGDLGLETTNLLAGLQTGIELWRPISQRIAFGGQAFAGVFGNFADGGWKVEVDDTDRFTRGDDRFQIAGSLGFDAKIRYQWNSRWQAFGGYRWWYLAGVATVDDQTIGPLASDTPFALSTDAGFLLQGATLGLEYLY